MSVEEIVRYVRQTPGNTNPSVVGSMVNAEMNSTLKAAKEYTDSQRLAYTEKKTITWDGNTEGKELCQLIFSTNSRLYHVSDEVVDLNNIKRIGVYDETRGAVNYIDISETTVHRSGLLSWLSVKNYSVCVFVSLDNVNIDGAAYKKGTYVEAGDTVNKKFYTAIVEFETVHQIDKKFIPNTVINLCDYGINMYEILGGGLGKPVVHSLLQIQKNYGRRFQWTILP